MWSRYHNYLSALLQSADRNPSAVCYYSDIQWIGDDVARIVCPSVTGFPINRALFFFESMNGIPFRGLIRKEAIERTGPIRLTAFESSQEEFLWLATLGREGNLHRVEGPLYFKRSRKNSVSAKFSSRETSWKRSVWLEYGLGMLEVIWPLVAPEDRNIAVGIAIDRLCYPANARFMFYDPTPERVAFAADFLKQALVRFELPDIRKALARPKQEKKYSGAIAGDLIDQALSYLGFTRAVEAEAVNTGKVKLDFRAGSAALSLLEAGWSVPENWGVWSDGSVAKVWLPMPFKNELCRIKCYGKSFGADPRRRILARVGETQTWRQWRFEPEMSEQELVFEGLGANVTLHLAFPDAVSPAELGVSADTRRLGFGLIQIELSRANPSNPPA